MDSGSYTERVIGEGALRLLPIRKPETFPIYLAAHTRAQVAGGGLNRMGRWSISSSCRVSEPEASHLKTGSVPRFTTAPTKGRRWTVEATQKR